MPSLFAEVFSTTVYVVDCKSAARTRVSVLVGHDPRGDAVWVLLRPDGKFGSLRLEPPDTAAIEAALRVSIKEVTAYSSRVREG